MCLRFLHSLNNHHNLKRKDTTKYTRQLHQYPASSVSFLLQKSSNCGKTLKICFATTPKNVCLTHTSLFVSVSEYIKGNIAKIRKFLSMHTTEKPIHSFILSKLDTCNSILFGLPKRTISKLQYVQNAAAHLISLSRKSDHITPILINLHWLPINEWIKFKILLITLKSINQMTPLYISDMIKRYTPSRQLQSSSSTLFERQNYNLKSHGYRSFSVCAPELWNSLPPSIRDITNLSTFKSKHFFSNKLLICNFMYWSFFCIVFIDIFYSA